MLFGRLKPNLLLMAAAFTWITWWTAGSAHALSAGKRLGQCRLDVWESREGLPGNDITSLAQTSDGYIWVGTTAGLYRFDGQSFIRFDRTTVTGLTSNVINALMPARDGRLWVGTEWDGFGWLDGHTYHRVDSETAWNSTHCLFEAADGSILAGYISQNQKGIVRYYQGQLSNLAFSNGEFSTSFATLSDGSSVTSVLYDRLKVVKDAKLSDYPLAKPLPNTDMRCMIRRANGSIWVGTDYGGVFDVDGGTYRQLTTSNGLSSNAINCLYEDNAHRLLVGTNDGLDIESPKGFEHIGPADGLGGYRVNAIMEDREGNVWVASGKSLNRFADTTLTPVEVASGKQPFLNLATPGIDGSVICSTRDGMYLQPAQPYLPARHIRTQGVEGGTQMSNGDIVAWNYHPGPGMHYDVHRYRNAVWTYFGQLDFAPAALLGEKEPLTFLGGAGEMESVGSKKVLHTLQSLGNPHVFCVTRATGGAYLLGTEAGLLRLNGTIATKVEAGVPAGYHVLSVDATDPGSLWLGTDHGLIRFTHGKATIYDTTSGMPDNDILQVLSDARGRVWIGGTFGICSISVGNIDAFDAHTVRLLTPTVYSQAEGVRSFPVLQAPVRSTSGLLWFVGQDGLTVVDPDHLDVNTIPPPIELDAAMVDGTTVVQGLKNAMPPGRGSFSVHFAGLSFNAPEKVRYRYRLLGYDPQWVDTSQHGAAFTNLTPGSYSFEVMACNNDGIWAEKPVVVEFAIRPHFYQTLPFRVLCVVGFLVLVVSTARIRMRQMELRARELEAKVAKRTAELATASAEVTAYADRLRERNGELQEIQAEIEAQNEELQATQQTLAEANEQLHALATTDGLTGLINHRAFHERLDAEWSRHHREQADLSLILLDVDNFKSFNDTYGHPAGDEVLRMVGQLLTGAGRAADIVARYGGEEFVVVAPHANAEGALELAERLRAAVAEGDWSVRPVTVSIGISTVRPDRGGTAALLISSADEALYRSKRAGKNRVTWAETDVDVEDLRSAA